MDLVVLVLSVEATRHGAQSALPDAAVVPDAGRWVRTRRMARAVARIRLRGQARSPVG